MRGGDESWLYLCLSSAQKTAVAIIDQMNVCWGGGGGGRGRGGVRAWRSGAVGGAGGGGGGLKVEGSDRRCLVDVCGPSPPFTAP